MTFVSEISPTSDADTSEVQPAPAADKLETEATTVGESAVVEGVPTDGDAAEQAAGPTGEQDSSDQEASDQHPANQTSDDQAIGDPTSGDRDQQDQVVNSGEAAMSDAATTADAESETESQPSETAEAVTPSSQEDPPVAPESDQPSFANLGLAEEVLRAVEASGYQSPTEIQARVIPELASGRDVLAQSQTGTGKTAAFALPILSHVDLHGDTPQALVLTPTRELAIQVARAFSTYAGKTKKFRVAAIYGGQDYEPQLKQLRRGAHVVVGTPGRVIDHVKRGSLDLSSVRCLVLDEADEMLNMGFLEDVEFVLQHSPEDQQIALFSATVPPAIRNISKHYLSDPVHITVRRKQVTAEQIDQKAIIVPPRLKQEVLRRYLEVEPTDGVIVFTKTKDATIALAERLGHGGFRAMALNGDMPQKVRERTVAQLKDGQIDILVATDVAARGLDVKRISHVVNFDLPHDNEAYVHRIGRTGRAGRDGHAILLVTPAQRGKLRSIEKTTRQKIEIAQPPSAEQLNQKRIDEFKASVKETVESKDLEFFTGLIESLANDSDLTPQTIAAALAFQSQRGRSFLAKDLPTAPEKNRQASRERNDRNDSFGDDSSRRSGPPRRLGPVRKGMSRYRIEVGRRDRVKPGNIVGAIANEGGIDGQFIGPMLIHDTFTILDLPESMPHDVMETLQRTWVAGKQLGLKVDTGGPNRVGGGDRSGEDSPGRPRFKRGKFQRGRDDDRGPAGKRGPHSKRGAGKRGPAGKGGYSKKRR
ncbi:DEAD/DEAH box helicase [Crateriforma spongiae]|uniref:DEAD/DEAH box helicase n=1 Tax=Crateriforma spongiae TaxID=2724528 RepID=UPI0039B01F79